MQKTFAEGEEISVRDLSPIICQQSMRYSEMTHDVLSYKALELFSRYGCQWFSLDPFCKIINPHQQKVALSLPWGKRAYDVHSPHGEGPWRHDVMQQFRIGVQYIPMFLTFLTLFHIFYAISLYF